MTDYKALFELELLKIAPQHRQGILSDIASLEFEVEPYTDQEVYGSYQLQVKLNQYAVQLLRVSR